MMHHFSFLLLHTYSSGTARYSVYCSFHLLLIGMFMYIEHVTSFCNCSEQSFQVMFKNELIVLVFAKKINK